MDDRQLLSIEREVRDLRHELRRSHISIWRLVFAVAVLVGLRDMLGRDFWTVAVFVAAVAAPVVILVLLIRWLCKLDDNVAQPSHAERMDTSKLPSSTPSSRGA